MMYNFFGENLIDEIVDGLAKSFNEIGNEIGNFTDHRGCMRTDVKLTDEAMTIVIDLPGVAKEDIKAELKDGSLVVTAKREVATDTDGDYVLQERFSGEISRSFPVGDQVKKEDITASYDNGVLTLVVVKKVEEPEEEDNTITID